MSSQQAGTRVLIVSVVTVVVLCHHASFAQQPEPSSAERRTAIEALLAARQYEAAGNAARAWLDEVEPASRDRSVEAARALDLLVQAHSRTRAAGSPESVALARQAMDLKRRLFGETHLEYAETLGHAARMLSAAAFEEGTSRWRQALSEQAGQAIDAALAIQLPVVESADLRTRRLVTRNLLLAASLVGTDEERLLRVEHAARLAESDGDLEAWADALERRAIRNLDPREATALRDRAIDIYQQLDVASVPFAMSLGNRATPLAWDGPTDEALDAIARTEVVLERLRGSIDTASPADRRMYRSVWTQVGLSLHRVAERELTRGRYQQALGLVERAQAIVDEFEPDQIDLLPDLLVTHAHALAGVGQFDRAFESGLRTEDMRRANVQGSISGMSELGATLLWAWGWRGLDAALSLLVDGRVSGDDAVVRAWDTAVRSRGLVAEELADRHRTVRTSGESDVRRLADEARDARQRFVDLVIGHPAPSVDDPEVAASREARERAEAALAQRVEASRRRDGQVPVDFGQLSAALPRGATLVAFRAYRHDHWRTGLAPGSAPGDGDRYAAFVLRWGGTPQVVGLGPAAEIHRLIMATADLLEAQASSDIGPSRRLEQSYRATARQLREKVWDPIAPLIGSSRRVFIVPDGAVNLVNFAALPVGNTRYLIEDGRQFHYLPTERHLTLGPAPARQYAGGLLAVGAPAFDDRAVLEPIEPPPTRGSSGGAPPTPVFRGRPASCGGFDDLAFDMLPWSGYELAEVSSIWQHANGGPATLLAGAGASEAIFKARAPGHRVLHVATHGFFLTGPCDASFNWQQLEFTDAGITNAHPLLLSGFAMAGSNQRASVDAPSDDGVLTAEEIAALDLEGVEWAVLSACDTGLGKIKIGEGVFGFPRAFQTAGVRTVIMSLWRIEDRAAQQWMGRLYQHRFAEHLDTADAVHQATLDVLQARRASGDSTHPVYWAGFVASGDWR